MSRTGQVLPEQKMPKLIVVAAFIAMPKATSNQFRQGKTRQICRCPCATAG